MSDGQWENKSWNKLKQRYGAKFSAQDFWDMLNKKYLASFLNIIPPTISGPRWDMYKKAHPPKETYSTGPRVIYPEAWGAAPVPSPEELQQRVAEAKLEEIRRQALWDYEQFEKPKLEQAQRQWEAEQAFAEKKWAAEQAPKELTPYEIAQIQLQERQWRAQQARELAGPESWIERWFYENLPAQQEAREAQIEARKYNPLIGGVTPKGTFLPPGIPTKGFLSDFTPEQATQWNLDVQRHRAEAEAGEWGLGGVVYRPEELAAAGIIPTGIGGEPAGTWGWPGVYGRVSVITGEQAEAARASQERAWLAGGGTQVGFEGQYPPLKTTAEGAALLARPTMAGYEEPLKVPKAPPAPAWLGKHFVPGMTEGQEIYKAPVTTLSGQLAQQVRPSEWLGLSGYLKWAGIAGQPASLEDYIAYMQSMYPSAEARSPRWRAPRV